MHLTSDRAASLAWCRRQLHELGLTCQTLGGFHLLFPAAGGAFVSRGTTLEEAVRRARDLRPRNLARWERPGRRKKDRGPTLFDGLED